MALIRAVLGLLIASLPLVILLGCVTHPNRTQGLINPRSGLRLVPGESIAIVTDPEAPAPELRREIAVKLATILDENAFRIVPPSESRFLLLFDFGTDAVAAGEQHAITGLDFTDLASDMSDVRWSPLPTRPATVQLRPQTVCDRKGNCITVYTGSFTVGSSSRASQTPNRVFPGDTTPSAVWIHYFVVSVIEAAEFRETGRAKIIWKGVAVLKAPGRRDPRKPLVLIDRMAAATLEHVGQAHEWTVWRESD